MAKIRTGSSFRRLVWCVSVALFVGLFLHLDECQARINQTQVLLNVNPYLDLESYKSFSDFKDTLRQAVGPGASGDNGNGNTLTKDAPAQAANDLKGSESSSYDALTKTSQTDYSGIEGILTIVAENVWPYLRIPGLPPALLRSNYKTFAPIVSLLYRTGEREYNTKVKNFIFSKNWIKVGSRLSDLKTELKQTFFDNGEKARTYINSRLRSRFGEGDLPDFLDFPTPPHTEAVIVNVREEEGQWGGLTEFAGWSEASGSDVFELRGIFDYQELQGSQVVYIPFRNTHLRLKIAIREDNVTKPQGYYLPPPPITTTKALVNSCPLRLVLPIKTFTSRTYLETPHVSECFQSGNYGRCLTFTNILTHTSFSPTGFRSVHVAGGIIVNPGDYGGNIKRLRYGANTLISGSTHNANFDFTHRFSNIKSRLWRSPLFRRYSAAQPLLLRGQNTVGQEEKTIVADHGLEWEVESIF